MNELSTFSARGIEIFFMDAFFQESFLLLTVLLPIVVIAGCMLRQNQNLRMTHGFFQTFTQCLARACLDVALVIGIVGTSIGIVAMVNSSGAGEAVESSVSVALLPVVWGGIFVGIGFFANNDSIQIEARISGPGVLFSVLFFLLTVLYLMLGTLVDLSPVYNPLASEALAPYAFVFVSCLFFLRVNGKSWIVSLTEGNLIATLGGLALGIVLWFKSGGGYEEGRNAIYVCAFTLLWGAMIYVLLYVISLWLGQREKNNYQIKTWHLSESTVFFIFLLYAPVSATEWTRESQDQAALQAQHDFQEEQIIELKAQLDVLIKKNGLQLPRKAEIFVRTEQLRALDPES